MITVLIVLMVGFGLQVGQDKKTRTQEIKNSKYGGLREGEDL